MKQFNLTIKPRTLAHIPSYTLLILWVLFTAVLIGWIMVASLSTTKEIFTNSLLKSGIHFNNYIKALVNHNVGKYFLNSLLYTFSSSFGIIFIAAPAAAPRPIPMVETTRMNREISPGGLAKTTPTTRRLYR